MFFWCFGASSKSIPLLLFLQGGHENTASTKISATGTLPTGSGGVGDGQNGEAAPATGTTVPATGTGAAPATGTGAAPATAAPATGMGAAPAAAAALAITGSGTVVATGDAGSRNECPRMALSNMLDHMAVLGPKNEKKGNAEKSDAESEESESESEGDGKKRKKNKKSKKAKGPREVPPEAICFSFSNIPWITLTSVFGFWGTPTQKRRWYVHQFPIGYPTSELFSLVGQSAA